MTTDSHAINVEFDVPARMRDGTILRANVYRPAGRGPWPVLLTRLPYGKDFAAGYSQLDPVQTARQGYLVVVQDTRGTNASDGDWYPFRSEASDGVDTIAWAAALPGADGQVGMYGGSYVGFTQWAAALGQPPALKAIAPAVTWADPLNGLAYRSGALELGVMANWHLGMGLGVLVRQHDADRAAQAAAVRAWAAEVDALATSGYQALPLTDFAPLRRQDVAPGFFDTLATPMDRTREPSASLTIVGRHEQLRVPSLNIGGWYDIFLADTITNFLRMHDSDVPTKLLIGPWSHASQRNPVGERSFGFAAQSGMIDLKQDLGSWQRRWFDHWLKGIDTGMLAEAPIKLFVMGTDVWRDEHAWPLARAVETRWYLHADGVLSREPPGAEPPDRYRYDPSNPVPTRGGATLLTPEYPAGPFDQRPIEARADVLVYVTAPLERDTEVTGPIRVQLWATSSAPDTDFVARLSDVFPDGRVINLTDGIVRARYRDFGEGATPSLLEPGRPYGYDIDLWATSNVFLAGHRIGLLITSSNFPRWDRNPNTGASFGTDAAVQVAHQTILHDTAHPSHVVLPVV